LPQWLVDEQERLQPRIILLIAMNTRLNPLLRSSQKTKTSADSLSYKSLFGKN
jgi:hypothetical protein